MKKFALVGFVLVVLLAFVAVGMAKTVSPDFNKVTIEKAQKISMSEAKKIALKKVEGKVEEEFEMEDQSGKVTSYLFVIRTKDKKAMEVTVDANTGEVLSVEEGIE